MRRHMSTPEANVLEGMLPDGMTTDMRDMALCLYEALVLSDGRCGSLGPAGDWLEQLALWAGQAMLQMQHLANEKGGRMFYLAKGVAVRLSQRDLEMCAKHRGHNYADLAKEYGLTEMRVRQIVNLYRRNQFLERQRQLPGLDPAQG